MQTTLLSFAVGLILALLAALIGPHFVNWNDHRAFFEAEASRLVGLPVKVGGDIDAGILPFPSVTLRAIAIGMAGEESRMRAKSLRIELGLGPLMRGELRATEMKLVTPQFSIGLDNRGQIDWPRLAIASETLSIDRLTVEDGRATLTDANSKTRLVLDQLWFSGMVGSLTGPIRGKGEFVNGGGLYGYEISAGRAGPDGTRLKISLKTDERPLTVEADGLLAFDHAVPRFDGTLTLSRPAVAVLASGKAASYEPWRLTSKVKTGEASATLDEVSFQYGPDERAVSLTGSAEFKFGDKPQLLGALAARQVDLDRLLATPQTPRYLPLPAVQAFGEMLGNALRPSWPVKLSLNVDAMTLGGAAVQNVATELRSDGTTWTLDRLEFRAPGFTQVKVDGRLYALGKGLGFAGGASVDSNDPKNLLAWIAGRTTATAQFKPWHFKGDVTLGSDRIAVEHLRTEIDRGAIEGSLAYAWPDGGRPARLNADLRAGDLDFDDVLGVGQSALGGLGLEWPGEVTLALEVGHARIAGFDAKNIAAKLSLDAGGLAIERLSIDDLGDTSVVATGRIQTLSSPGGSITLHLDARDLNGIVGLADRFEPALADPLRRLAARQKTAVLRATVSLEDGGAGTANGKIAMSGQLGPIRVNVSANASGKREAFTPADLGALAATDVRVDGQFEADKSAPLMELLGLDRMLEADKKPARLQVSANGPLNRELRFEGKLATGSIDANGIGTLRLGPDRPASLDLSQFAGTIGGNKVQGKLTLGFGDAARIEGSIDTDRLDAPAAIAAAIGMPARTGASGDAWSTEPIAWKPPGIDGHITFNAQHAALLPGVVAQNLHGEARFNRSEVVFEDIAGEIGKGHLDGRLAITNGGDGVTARLRVGLTGAEAGALFADAERPPVTGRLAFQTEIEGVGRSPAAFVGSLTGFGNLALEQAQFAGLNPEVFGAVTRAVELGIPVEGNRIREFVGGALDNANLPVSKASAAISISAGQARLRDIVIKSDRADLQATAGVDLADGTFDALLTLNGVASTPGAVRPAVLVTLKGLLRAPKRTVDTSLLTSWLTLRAVEQQSRQIDAMEQSRREAPDPPRPSPANPTPAPVAPMSIAPMSIAPGTNTTGEISGGARAPALPPPVTIPVTPKPRAAPKAQNAAPPSATPRPPGLVGAQN